MGFQKWTVQIEVHNSWVADGFDLDAERLHHMVAMDLRYAHGLEIKTKIIHAPDKKVIKKIQGGMI